MCCEGESVMESWRGVDCATDQESASDVNVDDIDADVVPERTKLDFDHADAAADAAGTPENAGDAGAECAGATDDDDDQSAERGSAQDETSVGDTVVFVPSEGGSSLNGEEGL